MMNDLEALWDAEIGVSIAKMGAGSFNSHESCENMSLHAFGRVIAKMMEICRALVALFPLIQKAPPRGFPRLRENRYMELWEIGESGDNAVVVFLGRELGCRSTMAGPPSPALER